MEKGSTTTNLPPKVNINEDLNNHYKLSLVNLKIIIQWSVPEMQKGGDGGTNHGKAMNASWGSFTKRTACWKKWGSGMDHSLVSSWAVRHLAQLADGPTLHNSWYREGV